MSGTLRFRFNEAGTRFLIHPRAKTRTGTRTPEAVHVNAAPGTIDPGPADDRIYVIDATNKTAYTKDATGEPRWTPPYPASKPRLPPVRPTADGHFDHLEPGTRPFSAAATFATVCCALEIWEHHFQRPLPWYFSKTDGPRLEVIPRARTNNSWSGAGFLEFGYPGYPDSHDDPFCENFDCVAHETGHLIMKYVIGNMPNDEKSLQYRAHEEAAADLIALVAVLHFDSVVDHVLARTQGKLFSVNEISRIGEWGPTKREEVRRLLTNSTMSMVRALKNLTKHKLSLPFSGGAFDVFVEIYESRLVAREAIPRSLGERSRRVVGKAIPGLRAEFGRRFRRNPTAFRDALLEARDDFARLLARTWSLTSKDGLLYSKVVANMIAADTELNHGRYREIIRAAFARREISPATST